MKRKISPEFHKSPYLHWLFFLLSNKAGKQFFSNNHGHSVNAAIANIVAFFIQLINVAFTFDRLPILLSFGVGSRTFSCQKFLWMIGTTEKEKKFQNTSEISDRF